MSESREALLARFRAKLRARVLRVAELFEALDGAGSRRQEKRRDALSELHTLKGEARLLGLTTLASLAHDLEGQAAEPVEVADWSRWLDPMRRELDESAPAALARARSSSTARVSSGATDSSATVSAAGGSGLARIGTDVNAGPASSGDLSGAAAEQVRLEPMLRDLSRHAQALAEQAGKVLRAEVRAEGVELERFVLDELGPALLHLLENAVDHGLELPHERGDKPELAWLLVSAEVQGARVVLTVEDDGRGIDPEAIRAVAVTRGVHGAVLASELVERELLQLLFEHGFSTRSDVTQLSGRGVGLDVVRRRVESLGGQVTVESELGRGTRFVISVPSLSLEAKTNG